MYALWRSRLWCRIRHLRRLNVAERPGLSQRLCLSSEYLGPLYDLRPFLQKGRVESLDRLDAKKRRRINQTARFKSRLGSTSFRRLSHAKCVSVDADRLPGRFGLEFQQRLDAPPKHVTASLASRIKRSCLVEIITHLRPSQPAFSPRDRGFKSCGTVGHVRRLKP